MTTPIRTTDMTTQWLVEQLLIDLGEDPDREGLKDTPGRMVAAIRELMGTTCYVAHGGRSDLEKVIISKLFKAVFKEPYDEMIVVRDIEFVSLCEHHVLPFQGHVHVGYLPDGGVLGLSKFARVVNYFARKLQVQERLSKEVANALWENIKPRPKGVGVVIEAEHLCMKIRGVMKQDPKMVTSELLGNFKEPSVKKEFMDLVFGRK